MTDSAIANGTTHIFINCVSPASSAGRVSKIIYFHIPGDPGAESGNEEKSKRAEKYGTKKSKERRQEPLGTISYQTSSKQSPPFWLLIGARKTQVFWHQ